MIDYTFLLMRYNQGTAGFAIQTEPNDRPYSLDPDLNLIFYTWSESHFKKWDSDQATSAPI